MYIDYNKNHTFSIVNNICTYGGINFSLSSGYYGHESTKSKTNLHYESYIKYKGFISKEKYTEIICLLYPSWLNIHPFTLNYLWDN